MNKKLTAVAIAGAFGVPCLTLADNSTVTISGRLDATFESVGASNSSAGQSTPVRNRVSDNTSFIRFSGKEDLGSGLNAIWQIESSIFVDGSGGGGRLAGRNSRLGLSGNFGTIFLGKWDTPYKYSTTGGFDLDPWGTWSLESSQALIGNGSSTPTNTSNTSSFERRQKNSVQYWTPIFSGFQARIAYGANEEKAAGANPYLWSFATIYENGPLYLALGHERHHDYQAAGKTDRGTRAGAAYNFGPVTLSALYERLEYETAAGDLKRNAWLVGADYRIGSGSIKGSYIKANSGSGSAPAGTAVGNVISGPESGAKHWTLGYSYALSKRTDVYAYYSKIKNDSAATYDFDTNPVGIPGPGASPRGVVLGMAHRF